MAMKNEIPKLPCDPGLTCTYPNCQCALDKPDDKETTIGVWIGIFFGFILEAGIALILIICYFAKQLDSVNQFWLGFGILGSIGAYFGYQRFKRMIR